MIRFLLSATFLLFTFSAWLQPLSGAYTIDPGTAAGGTNYQTFNAFLTDLNANGVSSAVTVSVKEGTYNESLLFSGHVGASAANVVRFQPDVTNTLPVTLTYASTSTTEATIKMGSTQYVEFDGLVIENTGASSSRIVYLTSGCGGIRFTNNTFNNVVVTNSSSTNYAHVYGTSAGLINEGLELTGNTFNNGSNVCYVISLSGTRSTKLKFTNNTATGFTGYGMYVTYMDTIIALNNDFSPDATTATSYAMYFTNLTTSTGSYHNIQNNKIAFATSGTFYGIYSSYTGSTTMRSKIVNNMISNDNAGSSSTCYGIYLLGDGDFDVYHNSVSLLGGSATASRGMYVSSTTSTAMPYTQGGYNVQNNIITNVGPGYAIEVVTGAATHFTTLNYNVYNGNAVNPFRWSSTNYADLASWQVATSMDANSYFGDPVFAGSSDLHVVGPLANDAGNNAVGVTTDIDGDARPLTPSTTVDIGADEFAVASCIAPSGLSAQNISFDQADLIWDVNNGETSWEIEVVASGATPTGSGTVVTSNPYTWTGLSPLTSYDYYVKADCGSSTSTFTGPYSFTTSCGPVIAPWYEPLTGTSDPACWSQSAVSGGPWTYTGNPGYTAANTVDHTNSSVGNYAWIDYSSTDATVVLEGPIVDVTALNVPELRFWIWSHYDGSGLTTYNPTYIEAFDGTTWQPLMTVQGDFGPQWTEFNVVIPPAYIYGANLVKIRFVGESGGDVNDFYNDILLDDISITEAPTCPAPTDLTLILSDTSSAIYTWTSTGSETEWKIEYGPSGFTPGSGTVQLTSTNPDTITGLNSNTFYDVYVYAVCSAGDTSFILGPLTFNTYNQGLYMEADAECGPNFIDISTTGIDLNLTDDTEAGLPLPFPWLFQGQLVNDITIGNNGGILVNTLSGNVGYTMTSGDGFYPFVQDLDNDINGVNQVGVLWSVQGTAPNRKFIVLWKDRTHYSGTTNPDPCTFEFIYDEATNEAYYVYPDVDFSNANYDFGADAEIGVRGPGNNIDVSINNASYLQNNECVHLYYTNCPKPTNLALQYVTPDEAAYSWNAGLSNETNWTVIYGPTGFDPSSSGTTLTTTSASVTLIGLDQLTTYDIYVYSECDNGDQSKALTGTFTTLPLCANPSGISAGTAIDSLFSDWSWTAFSPMYPSTGFNLSYGNPGFDPATEGTLVVTDNIPGDTTADVNFLAGGVYELYIQTVCDTLTSSYTGPITFTMPLSNDTVCGAQALAVDGIARTFNNSGATIESGEQTIAPPVTGAQETDGWLNNTMSYTTWFTFTAPASGNMRLSGVQADFNGQFAVYEATDCGAFGSFNLIAANDDAIDGSSLAPNFTVCGLTPGTEYYLVHDSYSTSQTGLYSIALSEIDLNAGAAGATVNICSKDTINLFSGISGYDQNGVWNDIEGTFHIVDDSLFSSNGLAYQVYTFEYRLVDGCAMDSVIASYEVFAPSSAGEDGSLTICKNEPAGLTSALGGTFQSGGQWYDATNAPIPTGEIAYGELSVPGTYNYKYIVGNGVCPDDTSIVTVQVKADCDFTGLDDLANASFTLYPNPTSNNVTISFGNMNEAMTVELMDASGKLVATYERKANENNLSVDLSTFERGVYFVKLHNDNFVGMQRVIKE